jgi:hypothetical protein
MKTTGFYLLIILFLLFSKLAAQNLDVDFTGVCGSNIGLNSNQTLAQSFTATKTGPLSVIKIGISTDVCTLTNTMNCVAKILWGECGNSVLATENFSVPTGINMTMYAINFASPTYIIAGNVYTIQISVLPNQGCLNDPRYGNREVYARWHLENGANCGGSYAGGTAYEPNCSAFPGDFYIQTYVKSYSDIKETDLLEKTSIFPNPTKGIFKIDLGDVYGKITLNLYSLTGGLVQSEVFHNTKMINYNIKTSNGVYFLKLNCDNKTFYSKIIKE